MMPHVHRMTRRPSLAIKLLTNADSTVAKNRLCSNSRDRRNGKLLFNFRALIAVDSFDEKINYTEAWNAYRAITTKVTTAHNWNLCLTN